MEANEPVEVYTVTNPAEAAIIANMLRDAGIQAMPDSRGSVFAGIEQISILVRAEDAERAREILQKTEPQGQDE
jgi:hypothetical protein